MKPTRLSKARCVCLRSRASGRGYRRSPSALGAAHGSKGRRICPGALLSMPLLYAVAVCKLRRLSERSQPRGRIEWHRQRVHRHCVAVLRVLARMRCQRQRSALEQRVPA